MTLASTLAEHGFSLSRFAKFAWFVLVYNIGVVLWGAYVRATGSGAGCGAHWPLCNGEVIPASPGTAMLIEFSHRVTSGLTVLFVVALLVWAFRSYEKSSPVRLGASLGMVFTITEALVGAGLVLFQLVAENDSMARALSVAVHLANTFLLLAALAMTAYWASGGRGVAWHNQGVLKWLIGLGLIGVLLLGISGAVTALGDTLFPSSSLAQGLQQDFSPTAQFLIRLRVFHPFIAATVGVYTVLLARVLGRLRPLPGVKQMALATTGLVIIQWVAGVANIYLLAPIWLQLFHLFLADMLWLALVLLVALSVSEQQVPEATSAPLRRVLEAILNAGSDA